MTDKNKQAAQLKSVVKKADKELLGVVREHEHPATSVFHFGAFDISPRHLAFWVVFETDAERDRFLADKAAPDAMRSTLAELGYPKAYVGHVLVTAESNETVKRDFQGNWWYAVK